MKPHIQIDCFIILSILNGICSYFSKLGEILGRGFAFQIGMLVFWLLILSIKNFYKRN